jgi:hypothetical protein
MFSKDRPPEVWWPKVPKEKPCLHYKASFLFAAALCEISGSFDIRFGAAY